MSLVSAIWPSPRHHILSETPDHPVLYFAPERLQATSRQFRAGFPGLVTYAVKANDAEEVLENLVAAGLRAFDVASPAEMRRVRGVLPGAVLHYNNPVRSADEIADAVVLGVASYAVDCAGELEKLIAGGVPKGAEVAVRLRLTVAGGAYDFGSKFGADPDGASDLLRRVAAAGFSPAMTFHPGTQCGDPGAWAAYIDGCAAVTRLSGVRLKRLNVGGGFPAHRFGAAPDLEAIFTGIDQAVTRAFGTEMPVLVCEPGRAMVAEAFALAARVKSLRPDGSVFLNDGIYGGLGEAPSLGTVARIEAIGADGARLTGPSRGRVVFGPTCDSLDRLPEPVALPEALAEGDWVIFRAMGAYSRATVTRFNGYGGIETVTVEGLD